MDNQGNQNKQDWLSRSPKSRIQSIMASLSLEESIKQAMSKDKQTSIDVRRIVDALQVILSDQMLYRNKSLRHRVQNSKNGWLKIEQLLKETKLLNLLKQIQLFNMIDRDHLIKLIKIDIQLNPCSLKVNKGFIRRKNPFINKLKLVKPIYVQNYIQEQKMRTIREELGSMTEIYKIDFIVGQKWGLVYAAQPDKLIEGSNAYQNCTMQIESQEQSNKKKRWSTNIRLLSYESIMKLNCSVDTCTRTNLLSQQLKPYQKAYIEYCTDHIKTQHFLNKRNQNSPNHNNQRLFGRQLNRLNEQRFENWERQIEQVQERQRMEHLTETRQENINITNSMMVPQSTEKIHRQKQFYMRKTFKRQRNTQLHNITNQAIDRFTKLYYPNLQFNMLLTSNHVNFNNVFSNSQNNQLNTDNNGLNVKLTAQLQELIDSALDSNLLTTFSNADQPSAMLISHTRINK